MTGTEDTTAPFERHRAVLTGLAYRMLGSMSEAQDILQEAFLRWRAAVRRAEVIDHPRAFLFKIVTRLCLDHLKSARARRETYVGTWLPEPVLDEAALAPDAAAGELAADLSVALLMTLERLSPPERAAFLLHDVFELDFAEVAALIGHSEESCRQLASRARTHLRTPRVRWRPSPDECVRLVTAFATAASTGDTETLRQLCADDAVLHADGGGRVAAALKPILGADRIARFITGGLAKNPLPADVRMRYADVNGLPGLVISTADATLQTFAFEHDEDGRVTAIYTVRNPDKLGHLPA
jgi:RNA polymerase sigma-70 factor, ECF subfamily